MKNITLPLAMILLPVVSQAAFYVNVGRDAEAGNGPTGTSGFNANYVAYNSGAHESTTTGALQTFTGVTFSEGGLGGTYSVGVQYTFPTETDPGNGNDAEDTRQSYGRNANALYEGTFYDDWIGIDARAANGGIGAGTTFTLTLTGLEANTEFNLHSYHFDSDNQVSTFTTSVTGSTLYTFGRSNGVLVDPTAYEYDFTLISDGAGVASIDFIMSGGASFLGQNGFDLTAIPEPSTYALIGGMLSLASVMVRRRR